MSAESIIEELRKGRERSKIPAEKDKEYKM
jgi:hypothetical protein